MNVSAAFSDPGSEFSLQLYAAMAAVQTGSLIESNWISQFTSKVNFTQNRMGGNNDFTGNWASTPISMGEVPGNSLVMYQDWAEEFEDEVNGFGSEEEVRERNRSSLKLSSGKVEMKDGWEVPEHYIDAKQAVSSITSNANSMGKFARASSGERQMLALCGRRGTESKYEMKGSIDPHDATIKQETESVMALSNNALQGPGGEKTRATTRNFQSWAMDAGVDESGCVPAASVDYTTATATGDSAFQRQHMTKIRAFISKTQNAGRRGIYESQFQLANLNMKLNDGAGTQPAMKMAAVKDLGIIINHDTLAYIKAKEDWSKDDAVRARLMGNTTGINTANAGNYLGVELFAVDKLPSSTRTGAGDATIIVDQNIILGRGALACMYNNRPLPGQRKYPGIGNSQMRRWMETNYPFEVFHFPKGGSRNGIPIISMRYFMGVVRNSFEVSNGVKEDCGVMSYYTVRQST